MFQNVQHLVSNSEECARACTEGEAHRRVCTQGGDAADWGDVLIPVLHWETHSGHPTFPRMQMKVSAHSARSPFRFSVQAGFVFGARVEAEEADGSW